MASSNTPQEDSTLRELQSNRHVELLDAIDELRFAHLSAQLKLPQLIVCGDTSAGKSSVLEAISGVRFPASDALCTRFASELVLLKDEKFSFTVQINPAKSRSQADQEHLKNFASGTTCNNVQDFAGVIQDAAKHLRILDEDASFFEDTLVAKVRGPGLPRLTLVDLPGLIHASAKEGDKDIRTVKRIVESYMCQPNSIVLAVVSANNSLANQEVLQLVKKHDSSLQRTLGIVTKPDLVPRGSQSEAEAIQCALNRSDFITLHSGWHILKNRAFESQDVSMDERDIEESSFFDRGNWRAVPEEDRGSRMLRIKLSDILLEAVRGSLPCIVGDIESRITVCDSLATSLGQPMETDAQRRGTLIDIGSSLDKLVSAGMHGHYTLFKSFFWDKPEVTNPRKLRTCLRHYLDKFSEDMLDGGMRFAYSDVKHAATDQCISFFSRRTDIAISSKTAFLSAQNLETSVEMHIQQCKATNPAATVAPVAYTSILSFQCSRWESLTLRCAERCWKIAKDFYLYALFYKTPEHIATRIAKRFVDSKLEAAKVQLMEKLKELLKPYKDRDFFTLNEEKLMKRTDAADLAQLQHHREVAQAKGIPMDQVTGPTRAQKVLNWVFEAYEIALSTFLDNFGTLAVEFCLVESLPELFTASDVNAMSSEELREMTSEPRHVAKSRASNTSQVETLKRALEICNKHTDVLDSYKNSPPSPLATVTPDPMIWREDVDNVKDSLPQPPVRAGTADELMEQLSSLNVSPPTPAATPSPRANSQAKKPRNQTLLPDSTTWTPPRTPPSSIYGLNGQSSAGLDEQAGSNPYRERPARKARLGKMQYGGGTSPSPLPSDTTYRQARVDDASSDEDSL